MNSIQSELVRVGLVEPKKRVSARKPPYRPERTRRPVQEYHSCEPLDKIQQAEGEAENFDGETLTKVILPVGEFGSPTLMVPYYDYDWGYYKVELVPISFCPFCGHQLKG